MGLTRDLGRRVELVSMDPHFEDISIALYRRDSRGQPVFLVHTYNQRDGAVQRVSAVVRRMMQLGRVAVDARGVYFPCGAAHERACRRLFLEACKLAPEKAAGPKSLTIFDKKSNGDLVVSSLGDGAYVLTGAGEGEKLAQRQRAVTAGLVKLGDMVATDLDTGRVAFSCGQSHDELVGLLLRRALNVRGADSERQLSASRGQLLAPSAQQP